jgi:flagellin
VYSIQTNNSAIAANDRLRTINQDMTNTQTRMSSGLRVGKSADNAAYWSIATTMRSDNKVLSAIQDTLALGAAGVDVAYTGMKNAADVMAEFKAKLVAAREPGVDRDKINSELTELRAQMRTIADGASFNGSNWLVSEDGTIETDRDVVGSFVRSGNGVVRVGTITYPAGTMSEPNRLIDETSPGMYGILTQPGTASGWDTTMTNYTFMTGENAFPSARIMAVDDTTTDDEIETMIQGADYMHEQIIDAAAELGVLAHRIEVQQDFIHDISDSLSRGIGQLRDADMDNEATRFKALNVQEQLGVQSLSIANSGADNIMTLYRS